MSEPTKLSDFPEVRAMIQPQPEHYYPAPWRVAETDSRGHTVIVCAEGHYVATTPTPEVAQIIVLAVNAWADV